MYITFRVTVSDLYFTPSFALDPRDVDVPLCRTSGIARVHHISPDLFSRCSFWDLTFALLCVGSHFQVILGPPNHYISSPNHFLSLLALIRRELLHFAHHCISPPIYPIFQVCDYYGYLWCSTHSSDSTPNHCFHWYTWFKPKPMVAPVR